MGTWTKGPRANTHYSRSCAVTSVDLAPVAPIQKVPSPLALHARNFPHPLLFTPGSPPSPIFLGGSRGPDQSTLVGVQEWRDDAQCPWAETDGVSGNIFKCRSCVGATGFKRGCVGAKQEDPKRTQGTRNGVRTRESAVGLVFLMRFRDYRAGLYRRNSVRLMTSCTGSCTGDLGRSAHRVASLCRLEPNWLSS